jgi:cystathionine gamma-lyase
MYSLSKFTNGHSDAIMGAVTTNDKVFYEKLKYYQISTGVVPSPHDCYMVNRSLKTLALRMRMHSENAFEVAKFLDAHPKIEKVFHPSLSSHENHEVALRQSYGHSGILSFKIKGRFEDAKKFFKSLKLIMVAQSLGGVETNAAFPWTMSHSDMPEEQRLAAGVTENLVRLSIGLEDIQELIEDLDQSLNQL